MNNSSLSRRDFLRAGGGALAGVYVLGLAGCGGASSGGNGGGEGGSNWKPTQNVTMIVPFAPGGGSDILGRAMAKGLEEVRQDVNISVENRASGSGVVGYSYLLSKKGDPNLLLASESGAGITLPIAEDVPYTWKDFTPVAQIAEDHTMIIVPADSPFKSLKDLIKAAKQRRVAVGITGKTELDSIAFTLIAEDQKVKFDEVVFESGGEINTALLGGDVAAAGSNPGESIQQIEAKKFRALAVLTEERFSEGVLADVPTAKEQGVDIDVTPTLQYRGAFAASDISDAERAYWEKALVAWTKDKSYDEYIKTNYLTSAIRTGQEFEDFLAKQQSTVKPVIERIFGK